LTRPGAHTKPISVFVLLLGALAALAVGTSAQSRSGAAAKAAGLTLRATLPGAHYGPGQAVTILLTCRNEGRRAVTFRKSGAGSAVLVIGGEEKTIPEEVASDEARAGAGEPFRTLAPGESCLIRLTVKPPRKEMLPGTFRLRVHCPIEYGIGADADPGAKAHAATLVSNEVTLTIKYNVMVVY